MSPTDVPLQSPLNAKLGIEVEDLDDGRVRLTVDADASCHNELGRVHGGLISTLLDGAMGRCLGLTLKDGESCATVELSVQFLAEAKGRLTAVGRPTRIGGSVGFMEAECHRDDGTLVARAHGTWAIRRKPPRHGASSGLSTRATA